jgi:hypothetical protein
MFIKKFALRAAGTSLAAIVLQSSSDSARLEKLEQAVE